MGSERIGSDHQQGNAKMISPLPLLALSPPYNKPGACNGFSRARELGATLAPQVASHGSLPPPQVPSPSLAWQPLPRTWVGSSSSGRQLGLTALCSTWQLGSFRGSLWPYAPHGRQVAFRVLFFKTCQLAALCPSWL
ncbi:unnamed protein product [Calypogeia fissa]